MQKFNSKEFPTDHTNTTDKNSRRCSKFYRDLHNLWEIKKIFKVGKTQRRKEK
ncbi:hypothetical protein HMPREF0204_11253 [Chryseobacterium gleum ATCC 35910]|uniref:Uncharacterized protein n=1 Tax=Chryseobacterium gleum ATCC 35910 TaxID=525257 RepID=A0ABN0AU60_CHRGE|nr:hypothetical protein HMPREF0204_11253 [Chryseobacterium gleum ATCC 35910]